MNGSSERTAHRRFSAGLDRSCLTLTGTFLNVGSWVWSIDAAAELKTGHTADERG